MLKRLILVCSILCAAAISAFSQVQNPVPGNNQVESDLNFGMELFKNKMYDLAEEQFTKFLQEYPSSPSAGQARYYLAMSQYQLKDFADAARDFQAFAVQYPNDPMAPDGWIRAGECFARVKDFSNAALSYERLQVFYSKDDRAPAALVNAAKYFELAGDSTRAENSLVTVVENYPSSPSYFTATLELGDLYLARNDLAKAENQYQVLISSGSDSVRVMGMVALGRLDMMRGMSQEAEKYFDDAAELNIMPQSLDALLQSIDLDLAAGNFSLANRRAGQIDVSTLTSTQRKELLFITAYSSVGLGNLDSIRGNIGDLALLPTKYRVRLAGIFDIRGDYSDGVLMLKNLPAAEASEKVLSLYTDLAFKAGDIDLADSVLSESVRRGNPPNTTTVVELLTVEDQFLHDPERVRETFYRYENVLRQRPDAFLFYKACSDESSGDFKDAASGFDELIRNYPESDYAAAADSISSYVINFKSVDYRSAIANIADILLEQNTDRVGALFHLGKLYGHALKDYAKAADVYRRVMAITTGDTQRVAEFLLARSLDKTTDNPSGENSPAFAIYQKLSSGNTSDSVAAESLVRVLQMQAESGDSLGAENTALNFLKRFPDSNRAPVVYLSLADVLYTTGAYRQAIAQAQLSRTSPEAALLTARSQIALSLLPDAKGTLQNLISSHPPKKYLLPSQLLYASLLQKTDGNAGREYLAILGELVPSRYKDSIEVKFGDYLYAAGLYDSAYAVYSSIGDEALWSRVPVFAIYKMAYCKFKARQLQLAKELFGEVITNSSDPDEISDSYLQLGNIYSSLGDKQMSASFFEKAGTNNIDALVNAAATYFKVEDYQTAAQVYKRILNSTQSDTLKTFAAARLIEIDYRTNDIVDADAAAASFRKNYPNAPDEYPALFLIDKAKNLIDNKRYGEAQKLLNKVESSYKDTPSYTTALLEEARILVEAGEVDKAQSRLADLLKKYPDCPDAPEAHLELGNIYFAKQNYQEAIDNLRPVYADSLNVDRQVLRDAMSRLISAYESAGQYDGALDVTRKFIKMFPDDQSIMDKRIKVGILYEELRYFDQALVTFQGLVKQAGAQYQAELHYYIGAIYNDMGNYSNAILEFLKVPYLASSNPVIDWSAQAYYMAGQCYEKLNKPNDAIAMYEKIVHKPNTDPNYIAGAEREINRVKALLK